MEKSKRFDPVVLQTGFRIFFLGASGYTAVSMAFWLLFYVAGGNIFVGMPLTVWHAHEMIFGFTMAVVAGFLLTAVMNWTGKPTLSSIPLLILFLLWCAGRILAFMPATVPFSIAAAFNLLFIGFLIIAVLIPVIAVKQWRQSVVFSILFLIFSGCFLFYLYLIEGNLLAQRLMLRFVLYMIIGLILTIARRILPFFIEKGVGYPVTLRNNAVLDRAGLAAFCLFCLSDILLKTPFLTAALCFVIALIHIILLRGWYTFGIWRKPLLWILFMGYVFIILGFILKAVSLIGLKLDDAALHAWTSGGIGMFTLGMMARVSWGHTGRVLAEPPKQVTLIFMAVILSALLRVFFPLLNVERFVLWICLSQLFWILAFGGFFVLYFKALVSPRPDGKRG